LREVVEEEKQEVLKIALAASFAHCFGPDLLAKFVKAFPDVRLEVDSKWNDVDISNSDYDLCITYAEPQITEHVMDLLWDEEITPICAPGLLDEDDLADPAMALEKHTLIHIKTEAGDTQTWNQWGRVFNIPPVVTHRGMTFNTSVLGLRSAETGGGLVMTDPRLYADELRDGKLVAPRDKRCKSGYGYFLVVRRDDITNERIQQYRNWFVDFFASF
jgi:LysR family glycine cleavage system transcriptional activator